MTRKLKSLLNSLLRALTTSLRPLPAPGVEMPSLWPVALPEVVSGQEEHSRRQRAFPRMPMQLVVSVSTDCGRAVTGIVANLSEGGMAVEMSVPARVNTCIEVHFRLPGGESEFTAAGRVVWADKRGRAGVEFLDFPRIVDRQILSRWLQHLEQFDCSSAERQISYRRLFEHAHEGAFVSTPDGRLLDCNEALVRMLGYDSAAELIAIDVRKHYVDPHQRLELLSELHENGCVRGFEILLKKKDGSQVILLETSFAVRDSAGNVSFQGFLLDITEGKLAKQELQRRSGELNVLNNISQVADHSFDIETICRETLCQLSKLLVFDVGAVYLYDARNLLTLQAEMGYFTPAPAQMRLASDFWTALHESAAQLISEQRYPALPAIAKAPLKAEGMKHWRWGVLWSKEKVLGILEIATRDDHDFTTEDEVLLGSVCRQLAVAIDQVRLYNENSRAYENLRLAQEQLLQSEKMASVGQLTAGVAHELNNPLTAIMGYIELLKDQKPDESVLAYLEKIHAQSVRMQKIIQNLLSFSRQNKAQKTEVSVPRVLENTLALREYELKIKNIRLETEIEFPLPLVMGNAIELEQVFLNIVNNAVDSILSTGKSGTIKVRLFLENTHLTIEFHDSGAGIADIKHIFDPFYTTKPVGKGTGLGLSICHGIIQEHKGEIIPRNDPAGGAVFTINLPVIADSAITVAKRTSIRSPHVHLLAGRILVADPDRPTRLLLAETLRWAGAEVVTASYVEEARKLLSQEQFAAVVLEAAGPGTWDGMDLYRWVQQNCPAAAARLLMTFANFEEGKAHRFAQDTNVRLLTKPFELLDLIRSLQSMFGEAPLALAKRAVS
ncbi:MAG: ATP-binding protein [Terriglobales bacterium]